MAEQAVQGVQLPTDGAGKVTPAFKYTLADGTVLYLPATILIDRGGIELGSRILDTLDRIADRLEAIEQHTEATSATINS